MNSLAGHNDAHDRTDGNGNVSIGSAPLPSADADYLRRLKILHEVGHDLTRIETVDEVCRRAVEWGRSRLGFTRLGIWFRSDDPKVAVGSFGVDEHGNLRDERQSRVPIFPHTLMAKVFAHKAPATVLENTDIFDDRGSIIGAGTHAMAPMWDGEQIIGCVVTDDYLRPGSLAPHDGELLTLFASTLGHLCTRFRLEEALRKSKEELEVLVAERTTELRKTNEELQAELLHHWAAEEHIRFQADILAHVKEAVIATDMAGRITYWNRGAEAQYQLTTNEVIGRPALEVLQYRYTDHQTDDEVLEALDKRGYWYGEGLHVRKDGTELSIDASVSCLEGGDGTRIGYLAVLRDTTERRHAEELIRYQAALVTDVSDAIIATDMDYKINAWNKAAEKIYGWKAEEVTGKSLRDILEISYLNDESQENAVKDLFEKGRWWGENIQRRKNGSWINVQASVSLLRDYHGNPYGIVGVNRDITARRRMEETLRQTNETLRATIEACPLPVVSVDRDGKVVTWNLAAERVFGWAEQEVVGQWPPYIPASRLPEFEWVRQQLWTGEEVRDLEMIRERRDGFPLDIRLNIGPLHDADGNIAGAVAILEDITERKQAEQEIRRYSEKLEEMVTERTERIRELERINAESEKLAATGRMAARIAHEINNPLAGIKTSFLLVKGAVLPDHPYFEYVDRIEKEIDRIARIVRQMFELYRPDQELPQDFLISATLSDIVALLETTCTGRQIAIESNVEEPCTRVTMPENLIRQVIYNLLMNAIEASPEGGHVKVGAAMEDGVLCIRVQDEGLGIPDDLRTRIFEPFFTTKMDLPIVGLGLGLSVCKTIAESLRGSIDYEHIPGEGTVFTARLRLSVAPASDAYAS